MRVLLLIAVFILMQVLVQAEVLSSSDTHFELKHEAQSTLAPDELWRRLINPATWWHPDHTYSGSAANLSLDVTAGGLWREAWDGHSVAHGRVLYVEPGKTLRMEAPFGPLQGIGAYTIWTITIAPRETGSAVTFREVSSAPPTANMVEMAKAVDFVKAEAIARLVRAGEQP